MKYALSILFVLVLQGISWSEVNGIYRDIPYVPVNNSSFDAQRHVLDVYSPRIKDSLTEIVIFIHGGKWRTGSKDLFNYVGVNFAEKGKTAVLINYRLTPQVTYEEMAMDCAKAVKWVCSQIEYYGGDKTKIFLCGHSSGGHLASLISTNNRFFDSLGMENPVKGCMLIDAFGMDMESYLKKPNSNDTWMFDTFTKDEVKWKDASPANFISTSSPKHLMFVGGKTHNIIYHDAKNFGELMERKGIFADLSVMNKKRHLEMIGQMIDHRNVIYEKCITFMMSD
jgi:acetyl esterase/lipase